MSDLQVVTAGPHTGKTWSLVAWVCAGHTTGGWLGWSRVLVVPTWDRVDVLLARHAVDDVELRRRVYRPGLERLIMPTRRALRVLMGTRDVEIAVDDAEGLLTQALGRRPPKVAAFNAVPMTPAQLTDQAGNAILLRDLPAGWYEGREVTPRG